MKFPNLSASEKKFNKSLRGYAAFGGNRLLQWTYNLGQPFYALNRANKRSMYKSPQNKGN